MARGLKFLIKEVEGLYNLCSENKGAGQLQLPCSLSAPLFSHMGKAGFLMTQLKCQRQAIERLTGAERTGKFIPVLSNLMI